MPRRIFWPLSWQNCDLTRRQLKQGRKILWWKEADNTPIDGQISLEELK